MENTNNFQCDENVNFRWYLDMFKDDEMTWKIFFQMMKDMISFLDLVKSKKLIFDLLEELKGFKDKFSELEKSNDVLRKENENHSMGPSRIFCATSSKIIHQGVQIYSTF